MSAFRDFRLSWQRRSLRFQIASVIGVAGLLLLAIYAGLMTVFLHQYALDREGTALAEHAAALGSCSSRSLVVSVLAGPPTGAGAQPIQVTDTQEHAVIVDASGTVRYVSPMPAALRRTLVARLRQDGARNRPITAGTPGWSLEDGEIIADLKVSCREAPAPGIRSLSTNLRGGLLLAEDQSVAISAWHRLLVLVIAIGVVVTGLAVGVGLVAGEAMTRTVRAISRVARAIAAGDFRRRVVSRGPAEATEMSVAFNRMVDEVVRQRKVERDLLANISHELISPLALIRGYVEALLDNAFSTEQDRLGALQAIQAETARLNRLTADLLDLALLDTGQVSLHLEWVPVGELLAGLAQRFAPAMDRAGIALSAAADPDLPALLTDGQRLEQILVNLLNNAARHTPRGGTIAMAAAPAGDGVSISVRDSGTGIPAEELPRIWERFYQVEKGRDRAANQAGVGLGLAISQSTATLLHGSIEVESTAGAGTTFTIRLPLRIQGQDAPVSNL